MEHQKAIAAKSMTKILKYLPRATSSISFQNPPLYSPSKDKKSSEKPHKSNLGIGFSGPMHSIVSSDTRRKFKNDSKYTLLHEPTSPRVSCMGQVKCKHYYMKLTNNKQTNKFSRTMSSSCNYTPVRSYKIEENDQEKGVKSKKKYGIMSLFRKSKVALTCSKGQCLSTMKRFSSGRDVYRSFDWTTQVAPLDDVRDGGEEVVMASPAPANMVRNKGVDGVKLEPRKEINLWKRRTMAQPHPLQIN